MPFYTISYSLVDSMNRSGRKIFETQNLADFDAAKTAAATHAILLDDVTEMRILSYAVSERIIYSDSVDSGANRDEGATVTVRKADNYNAVHKIPAPVQGMRLSDGTVDLTNAAVIAYFDNFKTAGDLLLSDGELVEEIVRGTIDL